MGQKAISGKNGKHGRVVFSNSNTFGHIEICVEEWNLRELVQEEEVTNSCSAGKEEYEYGNTHLEIQLIMTLDLAQHPLDDPPAFRVGTTLDGILYLSEHDDESPLDSEGIWIVPTAVVTECSVSNPAVGKVRYEISLKSIGEYGYPYELVASGA